MTTTHLHDVCTHLGERNSLATGGTHAERETLATPNKINKEGLGLEENKKLHQPSQIVRTGDAIWSA